MQNGRSCAYKHASEIVASRTPLDDRARAKYTRSENELVLRFGRLEHILESLGKSREIRVQVGDEIEWSTQALENAAANRLSLSDVFGEVVDVYPFWSRSLQLLE